MILRSVQPMNDITFNKKINIYEDLFWVCLLKTWLE